jgi:exosortase family protein XrtG
MNIYLIIGVLLWLYILSLFKRAKLTAFFFIWGSVGLFFILITLSSPYWVWLWTHVITLVIGWLGSTTKMSLTMLKYNIISILNSAGSVNMTIDYECSGIIETLAFISLVVFFPIFSRYEKLFFSLLGTAWIFLANLLRLYLIIVIVHLGGGDYFFLAHSILGRIVFYVLAIALYYNVFTYSQLAHSFYVNWQHWLAKFHRLRS